jgi:small subunit ribosomal protein S16
MLKIKLSRVGKRDQSQYRVVIAEAHSKRDGKNVEIIGSYNPNTSPATVDIDTDKYTNWIQKGAQPTLTVRNLYNNITKAKSK